MNDNLVRAYALAIVALCVRSLLLRVHSQGESEDANISNGLFCLIICFTLDRLHRSARFARFSIPCAT